MRAKILTALMLVTGCGSEPLLPTECECDIWDRVRGEWTVLPCDSMPLCIDGQLTGCDWATQQLVVYRECGTEEPVVWCEMAAGEWRFTGSLRPGSHPDCFAEAFSDRYTAVLSQVVGLGAPCPDSCNCVDRGPVPPDCEASRLVGLCSDGSEMQTYARRVSSTSLSWQMALITDHGSCYIEGEGVWVGP
jgi:hypothetical protein